MKSRTWLAVGAVAALALGVAACGDDDDDNGGGAEQIAEVESIAKEVVESDGSNADFVFEHVTDNLIATVFFSDRDECMANADECIGEPSQVLSISGTSVSGDEASMRMLLDLGGLEADFDIGMVREDGTWKVDSFGAASDALPSGVTAVDLELTEFTFLFDPARIPGDGNLGFRVRNTGAQIHEVVLLGLEEGQELEEVVGAIFEDDDLSAVVGLKVFIFPGQDLNMAFAEPLAPGSYVLVCFFPDVTDPEFTSHLEKGMVAEFTVE